MCEILKEIIKCYIKIDKKYTDTTVRQRLRLNNELGQNETADIELYLIPLSS